MSSSGLTRGSIKLYEEIDPRVKPEDDKENVKPIHTKNRTIGLLGGSFNPAHEGHLHISLYALHKMQFDEVWWLVSPRNPLKSASDLASYGQRLQSAREVAAAYPRIRVLDIEARYGLRYSYQTLRLLKSRFRGTHFVWMMGADNLAQFHRWKRWQEMLATIPIAVFDRAPYSHTALRSKTMIRGWGRIKFLHLKRNSLSSTWLRGKLH